MKPFTRPSFSPVTDRAMTSATGAADEVTTGEEVAGESTALCSLIGSLALGLWT